jgi:hypothetical protein
MAMQIGMGFGKFLARVLFQELGVSVPSSVFHVLFITRSLHASNLEYTVSLPPNMRVPGYAVLPGLTLVSLS